MRKTILAFTILATSAFAFAKQPGSFAIITDDESYRRCGAELEAYRASVEEDGLRAYILHSKWRNPEQVKDSIALLYQNRSLEGAVFVGDIPIPMILGAQHFASAFKMDEDGNPRRDSSIPSDRFYDDFSLKFEFLGRDSVETDFFYYTLAADCPQEISCDIYTGRIKPSSDWGDKYEELSAYLRKLVRIKKEVNPLDKLVSYTGEGSFSNSMTAWKDETVTFREQFPAAWSTPDGCRFYIYSMEQYPKETILKEIARDDLDFIFFHEHGVPNRQYLSNIPEPECIMDCYELGRYRMHEKISRMMRREKKTHAEAVEQMKREYPYLGDEWFEDPGLPEVAASDSLLDAKTGIMLADVQSVKPNVRVALFDACYNGDFRESDCIASRYIFAGGNCVACFGNSVNVLQDKSSSDLLGLLSEGYRVGECARMTNIIESHVIGDPTFHFARSGKKLPALNDNRISRWKAVLKGDYPCDVKGLALRKLYRLRYTGMSDLLLETFLSSDEYMLRLQCLHLGAHFNDGNYSKMLASAADDPYEFIRRKAAYFMSKRCEKGMEDILARMSINDCNSRRVSFNIAFYTANFGPGVFPCAIRKAVSEAGYIYDSVSLLKYNLENYERGLSMFKLTKEALESEVASVRKRTLYVNSLRNNPAPVFADRILDIVTDDTADEKLRITYAEALGWFVYAWNREHIVNSLEFYLNGPGAVCEPVAKEIRKTINRLKDYLR